MDRRTVLRSGLVAAVAALVGCGTEQRPARQNGPVTSTRGPHGSRRVRYGDDPSQFGDLYLPDAAPVGVAVMIHGGFWKAAYGLEYGEPLALDLSERGWAAWNIEYRRVGTGAGGGGGVPATLDDVAAAIGLLATLDIAGDVDALPVVGIGHSAGGHLVTWAAGAESTGGRLTHVVSQAGVLDLRTAAAHGLGAGAVAAFLGHAPTDSAADAAVDPIRMVPLPTPVWCVHGRRDTIVPLSQSTDYVAAARAAGATAELVEVDGDHFDVIDVSGVAWARTVEILTGIGA